MGLSDFTNDPGNNDPGGNGPGGPSGPFGPGGMPPMGGMADSVDDVEEMLINYNERFKDADKTLFRDELIDQTISVLISKTKPNPLLVGSAGVGKTRIVEDIARRIAVGDPSLPKALKDHTIYELPLANLVAGSGIRGELESRLVGVVDFFCDPQNKAVLFIDEVHQLGKDSSDVYTKVAQILKPAMARGDMHMIGATTLQEARSIDDDPAFARRFSRLVVDELTREQTVQVLEAALPSYLSHYGYQINVPTALLNDVAVIADEKSRASDSRPDNALTLLDRAMADAAIRKERAIIRARTAGDHVALAALTSGFPLSAHKVAEVAQRLLTGMPASPAYDEAAISSELGQIKGQDDVLGEVLDLLRRDALGVFPRRAPLACMFAGASGVGKTEVAKIISQELTGQAPIILNMTEYAAEHQVAKIIGAPPGYVGSTSNKELVFDGLESNPYRVILLDELEKAHRDVQRLFLAVLDEGKITNASGKVLDFSKTMIIATTNAARKHSAGPSIGFANPAGNGDSEKSKLVRELQGHFEPELLGRFSHITAFNRIDRELYAEILADRYQREVIRIKDEKPGFAAMLDPILDPDVLAAEVAGFLPDQGARPAQAAARRLIEDSILDAQTAQAARNAALLSTAGAQAPARTGSTAHAPDQG